VLYCDLVLPKRFTLVHVLAISALCFCLSLKAEERDGWQFDSLRANSSVLKPDAQQIYEVLLKMLDRWNAHDIEGYMEVYSKSPGLFVVVDAEEYYGEFCSLFWNAKFSHPNGVCRFHPSPGEDCAGANTNQS
jgi:hypothetical protein